MTNSARALQLPFPGVAICASSPLSRAKVDGFGSDTKLSVGGRTWFVGVDLER